MAKTMRGKNTAKMSFFGIQHCFFHEPLPKHELQIHFDYYLRYLLNLPNWTITPKQTASKRPKQICKTSLPIWAEAGAN